MVVVVVLPVEVEDGPALEEAGASTAPTPCFVPTTSPVDNATATPGSFRLSPSLLSLSLSPLCSSPSPQFSLLSSSLPLPLSSHLFPSVSTLRFLSSSFYHFSYRDSFSCIPISLFACIPQERLSTLLLLFRSPLPRLARRCSPCCCAFASLSLSLSKRERGKERTERRERRSLCRSWQQQTALRLETERRSTTYALSP